ncbi:MAG: hypothetical protein ISS28_00385 [Candidatus Cloacimonetes bacterium]|nr:hypothetical protein [Candidatus Cloacimonadota bacterium]MBL7085544.1 hypothetical protein [Candidatus Cloacimonadota bacterium]
MKQTVSIIDMGTNSVLLLISKQEEHKWKILHRDARTSSLGKGFNNSMLTENAIKRVQNILADFINISNKYNCSKIIIVGTSVSREAKNIKRISNWLERNYFLKLYILSEDDEIKYIYLANQKEFSEFNNMLIFDIGGGSTEFILIKNNKIIAQKSLKIGVRRLNNLFEKTNDKKNYIKKILTDSHLLDKINFQFKSIGVGGTVTNLIAVKKQLKIYIPEQVHKHILNKSDVDYFTKLWASISIDEVKKLIPFEPLRADVLLSGSLILKEIFKYFSIINIYVSDCGLQFGILQVLYDTNKFC